MKYNPIVHNRRSIRLKGYDYSQTGLYYITICIKDRLCLLGRIENEKNVLNDAGVMVENEWLKISQRFPNVRLHSYVIMPNHFHAILEISDGVANVGATLVVALDESIKTPGKETTKVAHDEKSGFVLRATTRVAPTRKNTGIGNIIGAFKSIVTIEYIRGIDRYGWEPFNGQLWQRNYYETILRDNESYARISEYIKDNPAKWDDDELFHK